MSLRFQQTQPEEKEVVMGEDFDCSSDHNSSNIIDSLMVVINWFTIPDPSYYSR